MATAVSTWPPALANYMGEYPSLPASELTLNADITSTSLSIVATTNIPSSWPATGWITIDSEVIEYASFATATFTIASTAKRGIQSSYGAGAAASHTAGATIAYSVTAQAFNQLLVDFIAFAQGQHANNLVLNSDFARRQYPLGLAMPEVFADTSGYVLVSGTGGVASNIFTATGAPNELAWCNQSFVWRDGRVSGTFKAVSTTGIYRLKWRIDASNEISANFDGTGNFTLRKVIAGTPTTVSTVAQAVTLNRWYWFELEKQGTTIIVKVYDTGGTVSGVTKASSTLLQTLTGTVSDAGVQVGAHVSFNSDQATVQVGGIASGNGGVYVEIPLPESFSYAFNGTLGGQAIGLDEATDAGPIGKQWALRGYIPASGRSIEVYSTTATGPSLSPSTAYALSVYFKTSGKGGSGNLIETRFNTFDQAGGNAATITTLADAAETSFTRKTGTGTSASTARRATVDIHWNSGFTATGTAWIDLLQYEQGSAATAWRNAPADDDPIVWGFTSARDIALAADGEVDSRDLAANVFLPWDATLTVHISGVWANSGANADYAQVNASGTKTVVVALNGTTIVSFGGTISKATLTGLAAAAGKIRVAMLAARAAGTVTFYGSTYAATAMTIVATRGK